MSRPCGCLGNGKPVWREAGHVAKRCPCGLLYWEPFVTAKQALDDRHSDGYYSLPAECRVDWVQRWCRRGRLLEVGPGPGHLLAAAQRRGFEVFGVDPNPASVQRIYDTLGVEIELGRIETSQLPERSFDAIVHVDLLSHLEDPLVALRAMERKLLPNGVLCFEVGFQGGISPLWYHALGSLGFPEHRWIFSANSLARVLFRAGLGIVGMKQFGLAPAVALLLAKRLAIPLALRVAGYPNDASGLPPRANPTYRAYEWLMYMLRYQMGRFAPNIGPQTAFVAARALRTA